MSETPNQPRFAPFATMLVGVIVIYVLVSQIGRHPLPVLETAPSDAATAAAAKDATQDALLAQRERAMVTIGALPRPTAPTANQAARPLNRQAQANATVVAAARPAPAAPAPTRRAEPAPVKAVSAPAGAAAPSTLMAAAPAPAMAQARYYQVRGGDTLFSIARKTYGDGSHWKRIMQANRMASPAALAVGQKLLIPPLAETHTAWNR